MSQVNFTVVEGLLSMDQFQFTTTYINTVNSFYLVVDNSYKSNGMEANLNFSHTGEEKWRTTFCKMQCALHL